MRKANKISVVLSTGKKVSFEFSKHKIVSYYEGSLTKTEEKELRRIQSKFS